MYSELERKEYGKIQPFFKDAPKDPMLYAVLEGFQPGRVFVDQGARPSFALVWGGMEYAYLGGHLNSPEHQQAVSKIVEEEMLPALEGSGFVSVFPPDEAARQLLLTMFSHREPVSYGVNIYNFCGGESSNLSNHPGKLPTGYSLARLDQDNLAQEEFSHIQDDIIYCWESVGRFLELGLGFSVLHQGKPVSSCYAIGYGAGAYHITISTARDHRRKGLAKQAASAFLHQSLSDGKTIYWLNDAPNIASRKLAESLGFIYRQDLYPVDIPCAPGPFHLGLAGHFYSYLNLYQQAGELYQKAFKFQQGDVDTYLNAARAWARAQFPERALDCLQKAARAGSIDKQVLDESAFDGLRDLSEWYSIVNGLGG